MKELIRSLVELQDALRAIEEAEQVERRVPEEIHALDRRLEEAVGKLAAAREELAEVQKQRRHLEMEVASVETLISRHQEQMMSVKTNEAYRALQHEIGGERAKVRKLEDQILELMERSEELDGAIKLLDSEHAQERARGEQEKQRVTEKSQAASRDRERLQQLRKGIESKVPARILDNFNRIARARGGTGIVAAHNELCGGCHVRLRPQAFQEVRRGEMLHSCDSCKRYLYCPDEPQADDGAGDGSRAEEGRAPAGG